MIPVFESRRLSYYILPCGYARHVLAFYMENRDYIDKWEPVRPGNFYTEDYQKAALKAEYDLIRSKQYLRVWITRKDVPSRLIGSVCFSNFVYGAFRNCMIGYKIHQREANRGFGTEAVQTSLSYFHANFPAIHMALAYIQPDNLPSIALARKVGMVNDAFLPAFACTHDTWQDYLLYTYRF